MAQELELSEFGTIHEHGGKKESETETAVNSEQSERRLLRIGLLILGVLCILQAILNVSLHLALYSKEDINQFPCNISVIEDACQTELFQRNSAQLCSCCKNLLQELLRQRDLLQDTVRQFGKEGIREDYEDYEISGSGSGSGFWEEF